MKSRHFEQRYRSGDIPWDHGSVDCNLEDAITRHRIAPCRALDIGCGTGENSLWLARRGFRVTGCDFSATAIAAAHQKASASAIASVQFIAGDFLRGDMPGGPFGLAFDRGCLHCMDGERNRKRFARNVATQLGSEGLWLSLSGNADEPKRKVGPPQLHAEELVRTAEPFFEILSLATGHFGSDQPDPPRAWICLMRKRL